MEWFRVIKVIKEKSRLTNNKRKIIKEKHTKIIKWGDVELGKFLYNSVRIKKQYTDNEAVRFLI